MSPQYKGQMIAQGIRTHLSSPPLPALAHSTSSAANAAHPSTGSRRGSQRVACTVTCRTLVSEVSRRYMGDTVRMASSTSFEHCSRASYVSQFEPLVTRGVNGWYWVSASLNRDA